MFNLEILKLDDYRTVASQESQKSNVERGERSSLGANSRIVACLTALYLFAKSRPQLLVEHVQTLQPYLQIHCEQPGDFMVRLIKLLSSRLPDGKI